MSKYQFQKSDIYQLDSDIPINKLNITNPVLLRKLEQTLLENAYRTFIAELEHNTKFDEHYFKSLHQRTLETLYVWAGVYRNVDMSKGSSLFCRADYLVAESRKLFNRLEQENFLRSAAIGSQEHFADRLAYYHCELTALHPFYEFNGRITRLFFDLIAIFNGYDPIDYSKSLINISNTYIQASIACVQTASSSQLYEIILAGLSKQTKNR